MVLSKSVGALSAEQDRAVSFSSWVGERLTTVASPEASEEASSTPTSCLPPALPHPIPPEFQREYLQASAQARSSGDLDYVRVRLFGTNYTALLDNGASVCFIDSALVDQCGLRTVPVPALQVALGDESTVSVDRAVFTELRFAQGLRYNAKLLVMNLGPAPIILGQTFFKDLEVLVDHGPARTVTCPATAIRPAVVLPIISPPPDKKPSVNLTCISERQMTRELKRATRAGQPPILAHIRLRVRQRQIVLIG